ncbi:DUF429 domain-containing protein [Halomicrobium salinisoli]|uniref:DUF429 domain-containing protein n=1 Tax=Halomicrobium salinisoli TaxID=2878391 RepID=UPI001CF0972F|nr:DUF429 domain-containing protein [Halomicrobium salinisoli]
MADDVWVGAHYCGDRWLSMAFDRDGYASAAVHDGVGDVWFAHEDAERVVVDVPIGLPSEEANGDTGGDHAGRRRCDRLAREVLGERGDAIVAPPVREAARKRRYAVASRTHERRTGRELSRRAFELRDAVSVLDDLLEEFPDARDVLAPGHPELAFLAAADHPAEHDRDTAGGYAERLRALASIDRDAPPAVQSAAEAAAGSDVAVADVLDAALLAYTALPREGRLRSLPPDPPVDDRGLPRRLVYRSETPLTE